MNSIASLKSRLTHYSWLRPVLKRVNNFRCEAWDLIHGVDTCGAIPLVNLDFESESKTTGLEYQSHHPVVIRRGLEGLEIRHEDYSFVDIGCGKGRVLLIASEFPFRKITGVEFAPPLAEIARRNLQSFRSRHRKCFNLEVITGDALEYELAPEAQVLFFYSPFSPEILDRVLQKVEESFRRSPRNLLVVFSGTLPVRDRAFGSRAQYQRLGREQHMDIYRHR